MRKVSVTHSHNSQPGARIKVVIYIIHFCSWKMCFRRLSQKKKEENVILTIFNIPHYTLIHFSFDYQSRSYVCTADERMDWSKKLNLSHFIKEISQKIVPHRKILNSKEKEHHSMNTEEKQPTHGYNKSFKQIFHFLFNFLEWT